MDCPLIPWQMRMQKVWDWVEGLGPEEGRPWFPLGEHTPFSPAWQIVRICWGWPKRRDP